MLSDHEATFLHDRSTRGEILTEEEQTSLNEWYDVQDEAEFRQLHLKADEEVSTMKAQVEKALGDLAIVINRIQTIASENETLRQENTKLRHQLAHSNALQTA